MVGCVAALGVTVLLLRRSILTEKIARRGLHITREYSVDLFSLLRVGEVMDDNPPTVAADMTVMAFSDLIARGDSQITRRQGTLLLDERGHLAGIITRGDVVRALQGKAAATTTVLEAGKQTLIVTYADELLHDAIGKMLTNNIGRLPVVDRNNERKVIGYLGRANVMAARSRTMEEENVRERNPWFSSAVGLAK
jgi:chloride channel protein, CIC family